MCFSSGDKHPSDKASEGALGPRGGLIPPARGATLASPSPQGKLGVFLVYHLLCPKLNSSHMLILKETGSLGVCAMLIVPATEAPAEPQMHLLKASLRPWPPQRVSGGTREAGRKSGARVQDIGFCSSNSGCRRRGHWTLRAPGRTHRAVSGDAGRGEARAPPMPGKKSKQRNAHLECSVSLSHFLCSQQLVGSLESHVWCLLTDTAGKGQGNLSAPNHLPSRPRAGRQAHVRTHMHAHMHTSHANPNGL